MKAYTLKKKKGTEEYHLFEGDFTTDTTCNTQLTKESICKEMNKTESDGSKFKCLNEDEARIQIAKIGRQICGTCVSYLYTTKK